jgi:hypothetical protein
MTRITAETMPQSAFSSVRANRFHASVLTRGLWNPGHQHAGPAIALACRAVEDQARPHGLTHVARLTANLLRPLPLGEIDVFVQAEYVGRNVGHFSARLSAAGKDLALFTAMVQRENPVPLPDALPGHPLPKAPRTWDASEPAIFPVQEGLLGYSELVELRVAGGTLFRGPSTIWIRMRHPLVDTQLPSVYQRIAVAADSNNGISAILDFDSYSFVNPDLTINLLRRPVGDRFCLDARTLLGPHGCGHAESEIYDDQGYVGRALQTLAMRRHG